MKKWQHTVMVTLGTAAILWLFTATTNYYMFKARQSVLNDDNTLDHQMIREDVGTSRKIILHNLDKINKNVLELKDSINKTNDRVDKINTKLRVMDKEVKFIFRNTADLKKYKDIFTQNIRP